MTRRGIVLVYRGRDTTGRRRDGLTRGWPDPLIQSLQRAGWRTVTVTAVDGRVVGWIRSRGRGRLRDTWAEGRDT